MNTTTGSANEGIIDVVILDAGHIGFAAACAFAPHGVRLRIIERAHGISGGHNVIARAQELLHAIGVRDMLAGPCQSSVAHRAKPC